jgi:hypothetical protein
MGTLRTGLERNPMLDPDDCMSETLMNAQNLPCESAGGRGTCLRQALVDGGNRHFDLAASRCCNCTWRNW